MAPGAIRGISYLFSRPSWYPGCGRWPRSFPVRTGSRPSSGVPLCRVPPGAPPVAAHPALDRAPDMPPAARFRASPADSWPAAPTVSQRPPDSRERHPSHQPGPGDQGPYRGAGGSQDSRMTRSAKGTVAQPGTQVEARAGLKRGIRASGWGVLTQKLAYQCGSVIQGPAAYTNLRVHGVRLDDPGRLQCSSQHSGEISSLCGPRDKGNCTARGVSTDPSVTREQDISAAVYLGT